MHRVLWVDATQGASGDMILGALVDLGVPVQRIRTALKSLPIEGWSLEARPIERCALRATKVHVGVEAHEHGRDWKALCEIVEGGSLAPRVRRRVLTIFRRLIEAEAQVHGRSPEEIHLHEAGGTDAIVDIVGACVGLEHLEVDDMVVSPMTTGFGEVRCAHGVYPVPAPATAQLVRGAPVRGGTIEAERLTPTGAAILTALADGWGAMPAMRPSAVGYGAGSRDLGEVPNMLRMILGERDAAPAGDDARGEVAVLECTIDDATPQALAFAAQRLLCAGALDVTTGAVTMKKGRAGHHLTVLARPEDLERMAGLLLRETPTLGLRFRRERRYELERSSCLVETRFGSCEVKVGTLDGEVLQVWPEYDTCAAAAERHNVPLDQVQRAALEAYDSTKTGSEQGG